jgi:hypothetical protein
MNCPYCDHPVSDETPGFCAECGQSFEDTGEEGSYDESYAWEPPPPTAWERLKETLSPVLGTMREVAGQVGEAIQGVLEGLRERLPGGSLTLLGLGLVGLALVLSLLPFVAGIGFIGTPVMLLGGALVAVNEWRLVGADIRPLPPGLENLPEEMRHPAIAQLFALLTCTQALLMLGFGLVSLLWLLAALVLGYEQGQRFFAPSLEEDEGVYEDSLRHRLNPWVVVGAGVCSFSLLLPWARSNMPLLGESGGEQPLATITQFMLLLLACFALRRRGLAAMHPIVLVLGAVWLTMWFRLMMSPYTVGPWFFLPGLLMLDAVIVLHLLQMRRSEEPEPQPESDLERQE